MGDSVWIGSAAEDRILAEAKQRRVAYSRYASQFTTTDAETASALLRRHPNMSAGLTQALTMALQRGAIDQQMADQLADEDDGNWLEKVRDGVGDVLGDVVGATTAGLAEGVDFVYEQAIKPAIRGAFLVADTLAQEVIQRPLTAGLATLQGEGNLAETYSRYGDSAGLNILQGDTDNQAEGGLLGTGFFAGGRAAAEADAERTLTINGQRADIGQAFAGATVGNFVDPGSRLYDAVAGISGFAVDVGLDPLAWVTGGTATGARLAAKAGASASTVAAVRGGVTGARRASQALRAGDASAILTAAGAVNGSRRATVLVDEASNFFREPELLTRLKEADAFTIAKSWKRSSANRLDGEMINRLGAADTEAAVAEILLGAVAHGDITRRGITSGPGYFVRSNPLTGHRGLRYLRHDGKLSGISPKGVVSADSADEIWAAAEKLDSMMRQGNVGEDARRAIFNSTVKLEAGDYAGLFKVTTDALDNVAKNLPEDMKGLATLDEVSAVIRGASDDYREIIDDFRSYAIDSYGGPIDVPYARRAKAADGSDVMIATPQMTSQLSSLALHLPDVTDIRRAATKNALLRKVYTSKGWDLVADTTRSVTHEIFKPLAILRLAYIVRIGGEEQARLAAAGYDGLFKHPVDWIMANVLNRGALKDLTGDSLEGVARSLDVITKDAHGMLADPLASRSRVWSQVNVKLDDKGRLAADSYRGWRSELGQISAAPEARKMAELRGNTELFKEWAQGEGLKEIQRLSRISEKSKALLDFGPAFDRWAEGLAETIYAKTRWDDDIIQRVLDRRIPIPGLHGRQAKNIDAEFSQLLSAKTREGIAPDVVRIGMDDSPARLKMKDRMVDTLFDHITGKPTSRLARFPVFRQSMIRRGEELLDSLATDDLRREVLESFSKNLKPTKSEWNRLAQAAQDATGRSGPIESVADLNEILTTRSAQDVKDLLFDVTKRSAAQDALEVVVPFLDAWTEVTKTWAHLLKENPAFFIRAQAGYKELRDQGTFYLNEYGQEVFRYPGGGFLSTFVDEMNQRGGGIVNAPMAALEAAGRTVVGDTPAYSVAPEGSVQGINLVATGVGPGFGPVIQWGASVLDTPDTQKLREFIAPFGTGAVDDPEDALNFGGVLGSLMPAWMRKGINAVSEGKVDERQYNSMFGDAMRALVASGEYDPADPDRLIEDAKRYTEYQLLFRAGTQMMGPTGAQLSAQVEAPEVDTKHEDWDPKSDPSGRMFFLGVMREDYFRLTETYGFDVGAEKFYDMYGIEPFYVSQGKTTSQGRELPTDEVGQRWMNANSEIVDKYPLVAGFFAPNDEPGEFDFSVFAQQVVEGQRKSLKPEEQVALANKARARAIWARVQQQTEALPAAARESARAQAKGQLEKVHPGWQMDVVVQPRQVDKIAELARAAEDEGLDDNPVSQPLREYLALREQMLARVRARTGSPTATLGRQDAALERRQLMAAGLRLTQRSPSFMSVWSGLLKNELSED